jgi:hypothetical protein
MHTLILDLSSPDAGGSDMSGGGINGTVPVTVGLLSGPGGNSLIRTFSVTITGTGVSNTVLNDAGVTDGLFSIGLRVTPSVTAYVLGAAAFFRSIHDSRRSRWTSYRSMTVTTNALEGTFVTDDGTSSGVPEPATFALLPVGLVSIGVAPRHVAIDRQLGVSRQTKLLSHVPSRSSTVHRSPARFVA